MSLGMARPADMECATANILNKQSQTADKGRAFYCRYGRVLDRGFYSDMMPLICNLAPTFRRGSLPSASCSDLKMETASAFECRQLIANRDRVPLQKKTYLLTYLINYLLTYLRTYLITYLLTHLLTYSMEQSPS